MKLLWHFSGRKLLIKHRAAEWLVLTASVPSAMCRLFELTSHDLGKLTTPGITDCQIIKRLAHKFQKYTCR